MARAMVQHGRIKTTLVKGKEARRVIDQLITLGKEGSVHSRRRAYRVLQDRELVKRLFAEVAPRFLDVQGGYTRVLRLAPRPGDGAQVALLELTRLPVEPRPSTGKAKAKPAAAPTKPEETKSAQEPEHEGKPKNFFEGVRELFRKKKGGAES